MAHRRIGVPAYQTLTSQQNRLVYRRIGVHRQIGVPANRRISSQRSTQQIGTPANRRTDVSDSNVTTEQFGTPAKRRTGDRRTQANRLPANRRIRFQRSTQQKRLPSIGLSDSNVQHYKWVHRRIGVHRRIDYQQIGVSDSNVPHNRLVHRRIGVHTNESITGKSAYQIPTFNTTETITINRRIRFQRSTQQKRLP